MGSGTVRRKEPGYRCAQPGCACFLWPVNLPAEYREHTVTQNPSTKWQAEEE